MSTEKCMAFCTRHEGSISSYLHLPSGPSYNIFYRCYTVRSQGRGMLEARLIGKFDIQYDGKPVIISSRAAQSLFAYLILTVGTLHRREKLAGMLWPDESEQKARTYLRNEIWRIRKALPHTSNVEYLLADNLTVGFNKSAVYWLDAAALQNSD